MEKMIQNEVPEHQMLTKEAVQQMILQALEEQSGKACAQREEALAEKEKEMQQKEKLLKCQELLRQWGLPEALAQTLMGVSDDKLAETVEQWDALFRTLVQEAVENRLKGSTPSQGVMQDVSLLPDADYYAQIYPHLV